MVVVVVRDEDRVAAWEVRDFTGRVVEATWSGPLCWAGTKGEDGVEEEIEALVWLS